jgi:UDP-N-acetylglucosamine--N-acetylmuramyl-(pentapeptide) pyrophosphoryl-undecaprenol N-acetylglucosamine transferase
MSRKQYKVIIAGGGTGGHVFPAIAIARALVRIVQGVDVLFVGALGKMEMEKVPAAGFKIIGLPVAGFQRKFTFRNFLLPFKLMKSRRLAKKIIKDFQPDVVVGVGGYASWPVASVAARKGIPVLLQEQNSYPGLTNRMLGKKASKICVAYANMEQYFPKSKILITGNPVRHEIKNVALLKQEGKEHFGLQDDQQTILLVGGSLGALTMNKAIHAALPALSKSNIQLIWQTGSFYYNTALEAIKNYQQFRVYKFIERMDLAYASADVIVSRAGAIAISELCLVRKPVILIPSPNVAEDHQTKNARSLSDANAAVMLPDNEAIVNLGAVLVKLLEDMDKQYKLQVEISRLGFENADETIAHEIIGLFQ